MFANYKLNRKNEVIELEFKNISFESLDYCEDFLESIKSNWFNLSLQKTYKKDLFKKLLPILKLLNEKRESSLKIVEEKYSKLLENEKDSIINEFIAEDIRNLKGERK